MQTFHELQHLSRKMMNAEKRDDNNVLPIEINLVQFDKPKVIDRKSKKTSTKKDKLDSGNDVAGVEERSCSNVLYLILPPRQWQKNGVTYCQKISNQLPTRLDVKKLGEKLDTHLEQFKTNEMGICPIKRELYSQCFNEVIRHVTLNCAERGCMLIKIRDEMNMTIDSYQELYESVVAHGIRKALLTEHKKADLKKKAENLNTENSRLNAELVKTIEETARLERESTEARDAEVKRHAGELNTLKKTTQLFKDQLEYIIFDDDDI